MGNGEFLLGSENEQPQQPGDTTEESSSQQQDESSESAKDENIEKGSKVESNEHVSQTSETQQASYEDNNSSRHTEEYPSSSGVNEVAAANERNNRTPEPIKRISPAITKNSEKSRTLQMIEEARRNHAIKVKKEKEAARKQQEELRKKEHRNKEIFETWRKQKDEEGRS